MYAMHNGISKALDGPRRKPNQLYDYISNWLKKAENVQHTEGISLILLQTALLAGSGGSGTLLKRMHNSPFGLRTFEL